MIKQALLLHAATGVALFLGTACASADGNTPTSDSLTQPKITAPKDATAAALGTNAVITVEADNLDWQRAKATHLALPFHVEVETTKKRWFIPGSYMIVGLAPITSAGIVGTCCGALDIDDFSPYHYVTPVNHAASTRHVDQDTFWGTDILPDAPGIGTAARNACRKLHKDLTQQGMKREDIFAEDRQTSLSYDFRFVAPAAYMRKFGQLEFTWKQSQPYYQNITVICEKHADQIVRNPAVQPGSGDITTGFQVMQAALAITPDHYEAKCPAKLHLAPTLETNGKGKVRYRFRDQFGNASQIFETNFTKPDVKFLDHVVEIDGKGKPSKLGFTTPPQPIGDDGFGLVAPNDPNATKGYFQLEVLSPQKKLSNIADYSVKCTVQTAGDDLLAPPDVVVPPLVEGLTATPLFADLMIEEVQQSPATPSKIFVKVTNLGKAPSTPTNLKAFYWVGNQSGIRGTTVPAIAVGQSQVILAEIGAPYDSTTTLTLHVDDPNRIREQDEGNNNFMVK